MDSKVHNLTHSLRRRWRMKDIAEQLEAAADAGATAHREALYRAYTALKESSRLERKPGDESAIGNITEQLHRHLLSRQPTSGGEEPPLCEIVLGILDVFSRDFDTSFDDSLLTALVPFTDTEALWTSRTCATTASGLLEDQLSDETKKTNFIIETLLRGHIRPEVSKVRSNKLTPGGRKAEYEEGTGSRVGATNDTPLPWEGKGAHLISTFHWVIEESDSSLVGSNWPLFMPLLLGLLEDPDTEHRVHGLKMATYFIQRCPPHILRDRGIGMLLQDTMLPTLQFLPSITPEEESVRLLGVAYPALIQLCRGQFDEVQYLPDRRRLLDRLLREGVFLAFTHASEYVNIVQLLASQAAVIVHELGIHATKHLKDIIPMCGAIMTDPFLANQTSCLMAGIDVVEAFLLYCWPRVSAHYMGDIVKFISLCWLNLGDFEANEKSARAKTDLKKRLREVARLASELAGDKDQRVDQVLGPILIQTLQVED